jgi:hypothetical protein
MGGYDPFGLARALTELHRHRLCPEHTWSKRVRRTVSGPPKRREVWYSVKCTACGAAVARRSKAALLEALPLYPRGLDVVRTPTVVVQ